MAIHDDRAPQADPNSQNIAKSASQSRQPNRRGGRRAMRAMLHAAIIGGASLTMLGTTGCTTTSGLFKSAGGSGFCDEIVTKYRNRVAAEKAWHCRKASFGAQADNEVFKAGFIDGYVDIAEGGKGCTPMVAPKKYWGWRYQSAAGQNAAGSWFGGFPLGVQAAEEDGLGTFRRLPFCDRPGRTGCGTPACGDPTVANPLVPGLDGAVLDSPIVGTAIPGDPSAYSSPNAYGTDPIPGRVDVERLDGPAIEPDANDAVTPPTTDRGNPFNRSIRPGNGVGNGVAPAAPPRPATPPAGNAPARDPAPIDNPFSRSDADDDAMQLQDDVASADQADAIASPADQLFMDDQNDIVADTSAAAELFITDQKPTGPATSVADSASEGPEMTIEDIFGIESESSDGVEVEFDDLPFSFE